MRIGILRISVMQMLSALSLIVNAPINREARALLKQLLGLGTQRIMRHGSVVGGDTHDAQLLAEILANPLHERLGTTPDETRTGAVMTVLAFPALVVDLIFSKVINIFLLSPLLGLTWRRRKFLADAAAVQLTRYPDGLARALTHARSDGRAIPGGDWGAHIYVFDTRADVDVLRAIGEVQGLGRTVNFSMLVRHVRTMLSFPTAGSAAAAARAAYRERLSAALVAARAANPGSRGGLAGGATMSFFPATRRRIARLQAMGAQPGLVPGEMAGQWKVWLMAVSVVLLLACLIGALFTIGAWLVMALSMLVVVLPVGILHLLLRWNGG